MGDGALTVAGPAGRQPLMRLASDSRLTRLAAAGSTPAFSAIYERHHQEIYRYCRSILHNDEDARDALQNTMLKAMRGLEGEAREISLRPWLFRIAHNEAVTLVRRRRPETPLEAAAELPATATNFDARQRLRRLIDDMEQLTPRLKSALVMRELSGLGFAEIATALEMSPGGAKQAVYEARLALHEIEQGREMDCGAVREKLSAEDRRLLRSRQMRAHLKGCADCRAFIAAISSRRGQLAALAPPLSVPMAAHLLEGIFGSGSGGGGAAGLAAGGTATGLGAGAVAKLGVAGMIALGAGAAAVEVSRTDGGSPWQRATEVAVGGNDPTQPTALPSGSNQGTPAAAVHRRPEARERPRGGEGHQSRGSAAGVSGVEGGRPAAGTSPAAGSAQGTGQVGSLPAVDDPATTPVGESPPPAATEGSPAEDVEIGNGPPISAGPPAVPPGQTLTTPGEGATAPGQGGVAPGQTISPGQSGSAQGAPAAPRAG